MNAADVLYYGHQTVLKTVEGLPDSAWETPNVCGVWSTKEIIAHLASFEHLLIDVLHTYVGRDATGVLQGFLDAGPQAFNDVEVARRQATPAHEVFAEYVTTSEQVMSLLNQVGVNARRRTGMLPWYGGKYDLEDLIAYQYYGHKREHTAQINVFRDTLKSLA